jgi:hypothetical protein
MANYTKKKKKSFYTFFLSVNNLLDDRLTKRKNRCVWRLLALCSNKTKSGHGDNERERERERREEERGHTDRHWPSAGRRPSGHLMTTSLLS